MRLLRTLVALCLLATPALAVQTIMVPGGNILPSTQSPSGGRWVFSGTPLVVNPADPTNTSSGATPIPSNRFSTCVRFGDWPGYNAANAGASGANAGVWSNQAYIHGIPLSSGQWFMAGFFRPESFYGNGMLNSYGNQTTRGGGLIGLTTQGNAGLSFEWQGFGFQPLNVLANIWTLSGVPNTASQLINQWSFVAQLLDGTNLAATYNDGVLGAPDQPVTWPFTGPGDLIGLTFGSYYDTPGGTSGVDAHNYGGCLRDWIVVSGTPTPTELTNYRNGGDPLTIWSGRVWGYWHFTTDPHVSLTEPDVSGNGRDLTYFDAGNGLGFGGNHALPYLSGPGAVYLIDGSGHFEIFDTGGGVYVIRTVAAVTNLAAIYGSYNVTVVVNGYQFPTILYVTDGS